MKKIIKRITVPVLLAAMVFAAAVTTHATVYSDGTYKGYGKGYGGTLCVSVTIESGKISDIEVLSSNEDYQYAFSTIIKKIIARQSTDVDVVSGATMTSKGVMSAVADALEDAAVPEVITTTVSKKKADLATGGSVKIKAVSTSDIDESYSESYSWESSDESVATVDDGKITAVNTGSAKITVTGLKSGNVKTIKVTVTSPAEDGTVFIEDGGIYRVISASGKTAAYVPPSSSKKTVTVPASISYQSTSYKVTRIDEEAFLGDTKLSTLVIGKNVTAIGKNALKNTSDSVTYKVKGSYKKTVKLLKNAGASKKASYKKS